MSTDINLLFNNPLRYKYIVEYSELQIDMDNIEVGETQSLEFEKYDEAEKFLNDTKNSFIPYEINMYSILRESSWEALKHE